MSINPRVRLFSFFSIDTHQLFFICGLFLIHLGCDALRFEPRIDGNNKIIDDDDLYVESIEITYPNGGESFDPGTIVTITWENTIEPCEWGVNIVLIDDDEIADILKRPKGTVASLINRGRKQLLKKAKEQDVIIE